MDTHHGVFLSVTCGVQGQESKVFLVADIAQAMASPRSRTEVHGHGRRFGGLLFPAVGGAGSADAIPPSPIHPVRTYLCPRL